MRILVLQSWFKPVLKNDEADITYFNIDGLANNEFADFYSNLMRLRVLLEANDFDVVVCHSIGATLLIESSDYLKETKVIMYSPLYNNYTKLSKLLVQLPFIAKGGFNKALSVFKCLCKEKDYNRLENISKCYVDRNSKSAKRMFKQVKYRVPRRDLTLQNECYLVYGKHDKLLLNNSETMLKVFPNSKVFIVDCGHNTTDYVNVDLFINDVNA